MNNRVIVNIEHKDDPGVYPEVILVSNEDLLYQLRESLKISAVKFSFREKDGTVREAYGSLNPDIIGFLNYDHYKKEVENFMLDAEEVLQDPRETLSNIKVGMLKDVWRHKAQEQRLNKKPNGAVLVYFDLNSLNFRYIRKVSLLTVYP